MRFKKLISLAVAFCLAGAMLAMTSCVGDSVTDKTYKVGLITLHDDASTYDKNFIDGMKEAVEEMGLSWSDVKLETDVPENDEALVTVAEDMIAKGCKLIFADSFGHEAKMIETAKKYPNVTFAHATGTRAHTENLANYHNGFASIYEGRFLAGVVAGMKLVEMQKAGTLTSANFDNDTTIKMGYVGAWPYAEVVSGFTSYYLGARKILRENGLDANLYVIYTNSWYDPAAEQAAAEALIARGCALISQHADSMGAPNTCEKAGVPNVSYNGSTAAACPNTFMVSSRINWVPYYKQLIDYALNGKGTLTPDYTGTLQTGSVQLTEFGANVAAGTAEKVAELQAALEAGTLHVFDTDTFTVKGVKLTSYDADVDDMGDFVPETEVINSEEHYFMESYYRSAPYFDLRIDGVVELVD